LANAVLRPRLLGHAGDHHALQQLGGEGKRVTELPALVGRQRTGAPQHTGHHLLRHQDRRHRHSSPALFCSPTLLHSVADDQPGQRADTSPRPVSEMTPGQGHCFWTAKEMAEDQGV